MSSHQHLKTEINHHHTNNNYNKIENLKIFEKCSKTKMDNLNVCKNYPQKIEL
jgi:hypothetical protein